MYRLKPLVLALVGSLPGYLIAANIRRGVPDSFNLYAYGDGIGGYHLVYLNGVAHVGQQNQLNSSAPVARQLQWVPYPFFPALEKSTLPDYRSIDSEAPTPAEIL